MLNQKIVHTIVGVFILFGVLALLFLALQVSGLSYTFNENGYDVSAEFQNIGSLKVGAPVRVAGVKVGYIQSIHLNPATYQADVKLFIYDKYRNFPIDTSASIFTEGLLGSNYISLSPGYDSATLHNGSVINNTHQALILENLIGQFMYKIGGEKT